MTLHDKIIALYPELNIDNPIQNPFVNGTILLQNDSDGKGDYIANWSHPTLAKPTQEQLDEV
jgi:hypothetical protein